MCTSKTKQTASAEPEGGRFMPLQAGLLLTKAWALHCRFDASFFSFFAAFFSFGVFVAAFFCVFFASCDLLISCSS
jgi:hypothetical protein